MKIKKFQRGTDTYEDCNLLVADRTVEIYDEGERKIIARGYLKRMTIWSDEINLSVFAEADTENGFRHEVWCLEP